VTVEMLDFYISMCILALVFEQNGHGAAGFVNVVSENPVLLTVQLTLSVIVCNITVLWSAVAT